MPTPFTLTDQQRAAFEARGLLRLPGFHDPRSVAPMADAIWADMAARLGMVRNRPETWTTIRPAHFQRLVATPVFDAIGSPDLRRLADALLGDGAWAAPRRWGLPLVTMPTPAPDLPRCMWHFDLPGSDYRVGLAGLRLFTILEPLAPGGGGTLVVTGSHQLALAIGRRGGPIPSALMRKKLAAAHPWFADLVDAPMDGMARFMGEPVDVGGVAVSVEEMTGAPGDLIVMHPLMLHGMAHNGSDRPRMMATSTVWRGAAP